MILYIKFMHNATQPKIKYPYPLLDAKNRLLIWEKVKGIWKNKKPEPINELKKMRQEWNRCK